ncbi:DUF2339 domain-containing protein [Endozoicomonas sp. SM1973]|uniref:DUF2339 domain-containing protein n=1 Tax=Spartinivicinus marinus TaxID=2994442 RepID=A0A853I1D6_9GAMM|nr:DUF2339 domain-containing protein [Spartinivicinus marinus]MCX4026724.1 DUF2339 domain-containing protein [Spartinivicinus marinus]NYZ64558.1 DUF2339 domain-containing protein [Spartinivicinus marinus]
MDESAYQAEINQLKKELAELQAQFSSRASQLAAKLDSISIQLEQGQSDSLSAKNHDAAQSHYSDSAIEQDSQYQVELELEDVQLEEPTQVGIDASEVSSASSLDDQYQYLEPQQNVAEEQATGIYQQVTLSSEVNTDTSQSTEERSNKFIDALNWLVSAVVYIGPLARLIEQITLIYKHYQEQGKAPVFLMTAAGITTLVIGFGYLLQYSFTEFLPFYAKFVVCYLAGIAVSSLGCWLCIKKPAFSEYGSSLIGLGIIIDYLVTYFIGPYFEVVSDLTSFLIFGIITLVSYGLALIFETKVVATVTLLGGSLSPIVTGENIVVDQTFVLYLFLLAVASLHLACRISWRILANITLFTTLGLLEYGGYFWNNFNLASVFFLFGFFYLFGYNWSIENKQFKSSLAPFDLIAINSILFYFVYACFSLPASNLVAGVILLINAAIVAFLFQYFSLRTTVLGPVVSLVASLQLACALFALIPLNWFGILLGVEGLALVYFGHNYQAYYLRIEGYFLYAIALIKLVADVIFADWLSESFLLMDVLLPLMGLIGLLWGCFKLNQHYLDEQKSFEKIITNYANEGVSLAGICTWLIVCFISNLNWLAMSAVPILVWLMWRNRYYQLRLTEWLAYIVPVISLITAINLLSSFGVNNQITYYWLAQPMISWFNWLCVIVAFSLVNQLSFVDQFKLNSTKLVNLYQGIAYAVIPVFLALDIISLCLSHIFTGQYPVIGSQLWYNFAINLIIISAFLYVLINYLKPDNDSLYKQYRLILSEPLAIGLSVFFLLSVSAQYQLVWLNLAIIPWAVLLFGSLKLKLKVSELFAWLHPLCFIIAIVKGGIQVGSFHFSDQTLLTKMAWFELLFTGWAFPLFYKYASTVEDSRLTKAADTVRLIVYLLVPFIPLPHIYRHYPQFIVSAFWISLVICWCLNQLLKIKQLVVEFYIIFYLATIITVFNALVAAVTVFSITTLVNIIITLLSVSLLFLIEHPFTIKRLKQSKYQLSYGLGYYLFCFCLTALVYGFTSSYGFVNNIAVSLLPTLLVMTYCLLHQPVFAFMHAVFKLNYILILFLLILIPNLLTTKVGSAISIIILVLYGCLGLYITHKRCYQNKIFWKNYQTFNIQIWVGHGILLLSYLAIINLLFGNILVVATTIALLVHALVILFMTLQEYYRNILRLSLLLFAACTVKLVLYDMQDYSLFHKMLVMIAVGTILLVGAYQFQKMKEEA